MTSYLESIPPAPRWEMAGLARPEGDVRRIIIHCSATPPDADIGAPDIDRWHRERGWDGIGYHFVIRRDGRVERGRALGRIGAHTGGHNSDSLGICLVGGVTDAGGPEANYTQPQWESLMALLYALESYYSEEFRRELSIHGHNEFANKACPCFDVAVWVAGTYSDFVDDLEDPTAPEVGPGVTPEALVRAREAGWNDGYDEGYAAGLAAVISMVEGMR